jgi:prophage regulatory protein
LPAIQIGGRGQWRIERTKLEDYITGVYAKTRADITRRDVNASFDAPSNASPDVPPGALG